MQDVSYRYNPSYCRFQLLMQGLMTATKISVLSSCPAGSVRAYALQSTGWFAVGKPGKGSGKHAHRDVIFKEQKF